MKIGIEAQRIFRKDIHGMDMVVINQIKELMTLSPEGFEFVIYTRGERDTHEFPDHPQFTWRHHEAAYPIWEQIWLPKAAARDDVDLLHCTSNTAPIRCTVPLAITVHDIIYYDINPLFARGFTSYQRFGNLYRRWVVKPAMKRAKWVATVSRFEADRMRSIFPFLNGKLYPLYNAVNSNFQPQPAERIQPLLEKKQIEGPFFLFLGNTDPKKNTPRALKAFEKALEREPEMKMVVADLKVEYVQKVLGDSAPVVLKNIVPVGYILNSEMSVWMSAARFFLYPSLRESFGIPIIEAMASGCPVLTSSSTCMPEIAGGAAIHIDPEDVDGISESMVMLWNSDGERKRLRELGIARAKVFSWKENVQSLMKLYHD